MRVHTKKLHTDMNNHNPRESSISAEKVINKICNGRPEWCVMLRGLRYREGLTQIGLAKKLGITQGNLSAMENGKRPIGRNMAMRLGKLFDTDYRIFL